MSNIILITLFKMLIIDWLELVENLLLGGLYRSHNTEFKEVNLIARS